MIQLKTEAWYKIYQEACDLINELNMELQKLSQLLAIH